MPHDASPPAGRPIPARLTFALFAVVLALHLLGATTGWRYGMLPGNSFRQAQTALTTLFIKQSGEAALAYPTPVLGKPWSIPMEFPLYQWIVAGLNHLTGGPLVESARTVSLLGFYLTLPALWLLLRELGVDPARRWLVLAFVPACPVYIFYSRAFLIESLALLCATWFLAACHLGLRRPHRGWLAAAAIAGTGAGLVKVTTFLLFLVPLGVALAGQLGVATRGPAADRPAAWLRLRLAALTLALPAAATTAWILFTDAVKARNPAADMLRSGPQRAYNFGQLADRFSGDYWTRWLHLGAQAVIHPAVLAAVAALALLGPRRWRGPIAAGLGLFLLAPAVFPFLYAWHDYYYFANAGFLGVATGFAAVALLDSRLPRALGALLIAGALLLQAQLYRTHYLPDQQLAGNGDSGLTQLLFDLTGRSDVLVVAGQDWNSMLPWSAQRRALMIRRGHEHNLPYLERAFGDLQGELVAALVLTGDTRDNARLLALAVARLNLHPEPFLAFRDSTVYVNRALRDEWSGRAPSFAYDQVRVLRRNESAPPVLAGAVGALHGRAVFDGLRPRPVRYDVPFGLSTFWPTPRFVLNTHAPTHLWFEPAAGPHRAKVEFGILDAAWQGPGRTDGVEFVLTQLGPGSRTRRLWSRLLNPAAVPADRGPQVAKFAFDLPAGATLQFSTLPGPGGSNAFDWAYLAGLVIQ